MNSEIHEKQKGSYSENLMVNPINTESYKMGEVVNFHQKNSEFHDSGNDLSLLSPKHEEDFTNPSIAIDSRNSETSIQDLQRGIGEDVHNGLPSVQHCRNTICKIKNKYAKGEYKKESTYQNALQNWENNLRQAEAREGRKNA